MSWRAIKWARKQRVGSQTAKAVLICQALHADNNGFCWPSQETIAKEIESSVDSVQRALKKVLVPTFVHRIKRKSSDGRRISDAYQLLLDRDLCGPCSSAPCGSVDDSYQTAKRVAAEPQTDALPGSTVRPKYLEENINESSCRNVRDTLGGARLEKRLGKVIFNSWFAKVVFVGERGQLLILQAENRHLADHIEQQFDHRILECFQPECRQAVRVRVFVRKDKTLSEGGGYRKL
jgi:Helix-turn-helix domain/DnaA N-terminal domain